VTPALLTLLTFLAGVLVVCAGYSILTDVFLRDRDRVRRRLDEEFRRRQRESIQRSVVFKNLAALAEEAADDDDQPGLRERFVSMVEQSGVRTTPARLLAIMAVGGFATGALVGVFRQHVLAGAAAACVGTAVPFLYVLFKRKARLDKLMSQLPDAFDLMARVIRAGQTISQALQGVADEFDQPISGEFSYCYEQQNLGLAPEVALRDLARRSGLLEIKIFVLALLIQQQSGGNLAEMLDKLADIIRDRFRIRGKIRALTAEGRFQALILLVMPPGMMAMLASMNQNYADALYKHPNMIVAALVAEAIGAVWIRKIVNFDY
jgi:tight adherence protein B